MTVTALPVLQLAGWCNYVVNCILAKPISVSLTFSMACKAGGRQLIVLHTHKGKSREENEFPRGRPRTEDRPGGKVEVLAGRDRPNGQGDLECQ